MRDRTTRTVLYTLLRVAKVTSAAFTESVKRAITEQTIEMFGIYSPVTGKKFAFPVAEKFIMFSLLLIHNEKL